MVSCRIACLSIRSDPVVRFEDRAIGDACRTLQVVAHSCRRQGSRWIDFEFCLA